MAVVTVVTEDRTHEVDVDVQDAALWLAPETLTRTTGWRLEPAGLCRGTVCMPLPAGRDREIVRADGAVDLAAFARHRGQALVCDATRSVWVLGTEPGPQGGTSIDAPDFTLPDLQGREHALHEYRGRKVLLASWASW